jgi:hypothetical protein
MYPRQQPHIPPKYSQIVFSKHARERMAQRIISEDMVRYTIALPDKTYLEEDGDTKFIRTIAGVRLHVVCKPIPDEDKWLVKSTWVRGEDDFGNTVDRSAYYKGKQQRYSTPTPRTPQQPHPRPVPTQPAASGIWLNVVLLLLLIALIGGLIYLLAR